ncbi:hypothetical protein [Methylobacterium marchantiae]|uniref:Uncharacterized protein n=1 Tax=Methylobacterium marchantiae TaxID=600331 RepID=A0ABW3X1B3_9HYPH
MDAEQAKIKACAAYQARYPQDIHVTATDFIEKAFSGSLVSIRAEEPSGNITEEVVYLDKSYNVTIFNTTEELVRFMQNKSKMWIVDLISDQSFVTGIVFISLIVFIFLLGMQGNDKFGKEPLAALSSVLGAAAGFYFSQKKT